MYEWTFDDFFGNAPADLDVEAIRREWLALRPPYAVSERRLPLPVWARRGLSDGGEQAWGVLRGEVPTLDLARPFCIYIHIPFCAGRCAFCDCYSFPLRRHAGHLEAYVALLEQEMRLWSALGTLAARPVSTVHLGGGTPTFLPAPLLARLVEGCRARFHTTPQTEWALESTSSELTAEMFALLDRLGFTRLHVGVQSLEDAVRRRINRREPAATVLAKIARAVTLGWVVSVDLICGLPGQTLAGLLDDIAALAAAGVDGFSVYELQLSSRNRRFAEGNGLVPQDRLANYWLMQAAAQRLAALGYRKTLFNHFARAKDTNLYFTFPERGEDCLALGTIADGVFGDYHYRHPEYKEYCASVSESFPGLQGGLRRSTAENRVQPLEVALLSGRMPGERFAAILGTDEAQALFRSWQASALIEKDAARPGHWRLTGNGSWCVGKMMGELSAADGHDT